VEALTLQAEATYAATSPPRHVHDHVGNSSYLTALPTALPPFSNPTNGWEEQEGGGAFHVVQIKTMKI